MSITEKILRSHLLEGELCWDGPGEQISIKVDQTLWSDLTGIMAGQVLEAVNPSGVTARPSVFYVDHNTVATSTENADDHLYMRGIARRYEAYYSKPGNGICHFLHCQRFARPGLVMLGADSHTPTSGALGMLAIGSGGLTVGKSMLGEGFRLDTPRIMEVRLSGALRPGVSAKDVTLDLLRRLSVKGGIGYIMEFSGAGVAGLDVTQRATIANMSIEMGATTGIFPSDEMTRAFLRAQGREEHWVELKADADARYDKTLEIDLSALEPLAARPHMPDLVSRAAELGEVKVNSVFIGSCTNASYSDIRKAARILRGKKVHLDVDLTVGPGSRQVLELLIADGSLADLIASGARILECACGPCIGIGQLPPADGVAVRTSNRNFPGRSGTKTASVYLVSPETAAATALHGRIRDPREVFAVEELAGITEPDFYPLDDSMIIAPEDTEDPQSVEIVRGENITLLPEHGELEDQIRATLALRLGDNITTDDIIPGGSNILKFIANIPKFAEYVFHYTDPAFVERARALQSTAIVGGENYGQGSSREHAAMLPRFLGVRAVIAKSYARIHKENLINYGILPLEFKDPADYDRLEAGDVLALSGVRGLKAGGEAGVLVENKGFSVNTFLRVSAYDWQVLLAGGALNYLRAKLK
ncbi:aconitate hydratase, partial [Desulfovibrio sp. OttesenSCG-928-C14]|nr:aconitate hydratase [Desulfovibrio sp. OttesenSCG-928-C14]